MSEPKIDENDIRGQIELMNEIVKAIKQVRKIEKQINIKKKQLYALEERKCLVMKQVFLYSLRVPMFKETERDE